MGRSVRCLQRPSISNAAGVKRHKTRLFLINNTEKEISVETGLNKKKSCSAKRVRDSCSELSRGASNLDAQSLPLALDSSGPSLRCRPRPNKDQRGHREYKKQCCHSALRPLTKQSACLPCGI